MGSTRPPSQSPFRWIVLIMLIVLVFSMVYCYDQLFALQNQLMDTYSLSPLQYNMLYSIYGYVNVILPLISGILIDYIGINATSVLFYSLIIIGQSIWIFACGTQPFHTVRKYFLAKYFIGSEYLFASGLTISASRAASAIASFVSAQIYIAFNLISALLIGQILICISFIFLLCFICFDRMSNRTSQIEKKPLLKNKNKIDNESGFYLFESLKFLDRRFWILSVVLGAFYASYMTLTANQSSLLQSRYGYDYETANDLAMIAFVIAMFCCPLFGFLCDKYGQKLSLLTLSALLLIASHCLLGFGEWPIVGLIVFGIAMSLGSAILWPLILLVVDQKYHASALGISSIVDNGLQATSLVIAGLLTKNEDESDKYEYFVYWILSLAVLMLILTLWLWHIDSSLNEKPKKQKVTIESLDSCEMNEVDHSI